MKKIVFSLLLFSVSLFCQTEKDTKSVNEMRMNFSTFFNPQTHLPEPSFENQFDRMTLSTDFFK